MSEPRKPSLILLVAVVALLLLAGYVGAYYVMVDRLVDWNGTGELGVKPYYGDWLPVHWSKEEEWSDRFSVPFTPIHWLDRRIRPAAWDSEAAAKLVEDGCGS